MNKINNNPWSKAGVDAAYINTLVNLLTVLEVHRIELIEMRKKHQNISNYLERLNRNIKNTSNRINKYKPMLKIVNKNAYNKKYPPPNKK